MGHMARMKPLLVVVAAAMAAVAAASIDATGNDRRSFLPKKPPPHTNLRLRRPGRSGKGGKELKKTLASNRDNRVERGRDGRSPLPIVATKTTKTKTFRVRLNQNEVEESGGGGRGSGGEKSVAGRDDEYWCWECDARDSCTEGARLALASCSETDDKDDGRKRLGRQTFQYIVGGGGGGDGDGGAKGRDGADSQRNDAKWKGGGGGRIRAKGTDLCLSTSDAPLFTLRRCDESDVTQYLVGLDRYYNDDSLPDVKKFELRPLHKPDWCVSYSSRSEKNRLSGESINVLPCKEASDVREPFWVMYGVSVDDNEEQLLETTKTMKEQCTASSPCDECKGRCDKDDQCKKGLRCSGKDDKLENTRCTGPGMKGGGVCYRSVKEMGDDDVDDGMTKENQGKSGSGKQEIVADSDASSALTSDNKCDSKHRCGPCRGDCDYDYDCDSGLRCFRAKEKESVPGCSGEGMDGKGYCYRPHRKDVDDTSNPESSQKTEPKGDDDKKGKFGECEGNCADEEDCLDGLVCFRKDEGKAFDVPGCPGVKSSGKGYCIKKHDSGSDKHRSDGEGDQNSSCKGNGIDLSTYNYEDNVPASYSSPLDDKDTPQFVALSFDDNGKSGMDGVAGGMRWISTVLSNMHHANGAPVRVTFYHTTKYIANRVSESPALVKRSWRDALDLGHEVALHSHNHQHGSGYSPSMWSSEIEQCMSWLTKPFDPNENESNPNDESGIGASESLIKGWRTPYLEYNDDLMKALMDHGIWYDSSIEEGYGPDQDGRTFLWPYTLDSGWGGMYDPSIIGVHRGLWEMPIHPLIVPPDDVAERYSIEKGLRDRCKSAVSWFDVGSGKVTGLDYNLWVQFRMTPPEFLATLKYSLDLRLEGNRAPFMPGFHSDYYSDKYTAPNDWAPPSERRRALLDFVEYALGKPDVRMVPVRDVLYWMRDPVPANCLKRVR